MRVYRRLSAWRTARAVDAQQKLGGRDRGHGPDLGDERAAAGAGALVAKRKEPSFARDFGRKRGRAGNGLGLGKRRKVLDTPVERTGRQLGELLLSHWVDFEFGHHLRNGGRRRAQEQRRDDSSLHKGQS